MQTIPKDLKKYIKNKANPKIVKLMLQAKTCGNIKEYRRIRRELIRDYTDYRRYGSNE